MHIYNKYKDYSSLRGTNAVLSYGVLRRNEMLLDLWRRHWGSAPFRLLDIGTADGLTLAQFGASFRRGTLVGLDREGAHLEAARGRDLAVLGGDARRLPFAARAFDGVVLAATLKHIREYRTVLAECRRVLAPGGYLLLLDPTPLGIRIGSLLGHFDARYLHNIWDLKRARRVLAGSSFTVVEARRYLVAPVDLPGFRGMEALLVRIGLDFLFLQQALVARPAERRPMARAGAQASGRSGPDRCEDEVGLEPAQPSA